MNKKQSLNFKQNQKLVMTLAMRQAIEVLQMPVVELATWLEDQINQNPLLMPNQTPMRVPDQNTYSAKETLSEFLKRECAMAFYSKEEQTIALAICGFMDHQGFLTASYEEIAKYCLSSSSKVESIAYQISQFEPIGLATMNVQHCLLLQLQARQKHDTIAYQIIKNHWDLLINKNHTQLCKKMNISQNQLNEIIINDVRVLNPYPASIFQSTIAQKITPELQIKEVNGELKLHYLNDFLPQLSINDKYVRLIDVDGFTRPWLASAKWLKRIIHRREHLLIKLGTLIINQQYSYLLGITSTPTLLSPSMVAEDLEISYTTATRLLNNKYIETPRGIFPFTFFTSGSKLDQHRHIDKVYQALLSCVNAEDKKKPLSDLQIAQKMSKEGISISRRTVAKYRNKLNIPPVYSRKSNIST